MNKLKKYTSKKKGSIMMEYFVLMVVGLILLGGFLLFLDGGSRFATGSLGQVKGLQNESDSHEDLGKFERI